MKHVTIFTSGISVGDPGPAAIEVRIVDDAGVTIAQAGGEIGNATAHFAAYEAVMSGLQVAKEHFGEKTKDFHFDVTLDSEFVYEQLSGAREMKEPGLVPYFIEIHNMKVASFPNLAFSFVRN